MTAWWDGIVPSEITLDCEGSSHRLRWAEGELTTLDHADPAGERALAALGGEPIACIELLDRWLRHCDDLAVLVMASRGPGDPLRNANVPQRGWTAYMPLNASAPTPGVSYSASYRSSSEPVDEVETLLRLGSGLPERLVATVIAAWTERLGAQPVPAALHAAIYGRLTLAMRNWLDEDSLDVELTLLPDGGQPRVLRELDELLIELPFSWLSQVWARGFAVLAGRFCLAAERNSDGVWTLSTIAPDFGAPSPITITL